MPFPSGNNDGDLLGKLESLLAPLDKLRIALNSSDRAVLVFDGPELCYLNRVAEDLLNVEGSEIVGMPLRELKLQPDLRATLSRAVESCGRGRTPFREQLALGSNLYTLRASSAAGAIVLLTLQERKQSATQEQSPPKNYLPVSAFLHLANLVVRELPPGGEGSKLCREILETVSKGGQHTSWEGGDSNYRDDLFTVCRDTAHLLEYSFPATVILQLQVPEGTCSADYPGQELRRLLIQLATTCSEELSQGGTLVLSARQGEDSAVIEMKSMGELEPLDEDSLKESRELCKALGGHVVVWSESDKRVRLVNLPFSTDKPAEQAPSPALRRGAEGRGKSILLVDDEDAIRAVGRAALTRIGYTVYLAKDGVEGVELYRQKKDEIDLVLLDLVMPRLGGAGCFEQLKEINPQVKVVLMSGFTRNHRVNDLMESGCLHFLRKPFELSDLLSITKEVTQDGAS